MFHALSTSSWSTARFQASETAVLLLIHAQVYRSIVVDVPSLRELPCEASTRQSINAHLVPHCAEEACVAANVTNGFWKKMHFAMCRQSQLLLTADLALQTRKGIRIILNDKVWSLDSACLHCVQSE